MHQAASTCERLAKSAASDAAEHSAGRAATAGVHARQATEATWPDEAAVDGADDVWLLYRHVGVVGAACTGV